MPSQTSNAQPKPISLEAAENPPSEFTSLAPKQHRRVVIPPLYRAHVDHVLEKGLLFSGQGILHIDGYHELILILSNVLQGIVFSGRMTEQVLDTICAELEALEKKYEQRTGLPSPERIETRRRRVAVGFDKS